MKISKKEDTTCSRRQFLTAVASTAAAAVIGLRLKDGQNEFGAWLRHVFKGDSAAPVIIGRKYLEMAPEESSESQLLSVFLGAIDPVPTDRFSVLDARLRHLRQIDFAEGDLIAIDGWLLARTEARLCALATLLSTG